MQRIFCQLCTIVLLTIQAFVYGQTVELATIDGLTVCSEASIEVELTNTNSSVPITGVSVTLDLPCGLEYVVTDKATN